MNREALITRKHEIIAQIQRSRRQLEREQQAQTPNPRRVQELQRRLEQLMAEEYRLRLAIDRSK